MTESDADPDHDEQTVVSYFPVPSVPKSVAVLIVACVLATGNLYMAVKGTQTAKWAWRDVKDGIRRGWLA